jgi:FAD/FMN-containing dehydrogenase
MITTSEAHLSLLHLRDGGAAEVIAPGDAGYDAARQVFLRQVDRRPAAIVRPRDQYGVRRVIEIARESALELSVRSGGHSGAGHGVTAGGVVLDLTRLKALKIDPERRVAWAQGASPPEGSPPLPRSTASASVSAIPARWESED